MGTVITIVILTTLVQTVYKHLSKPKYEAKEDAPNDPTHGGQGQPTRLGAGHLRERLSMSMSSYNRWSGSLAGLKVTRG